MIEIFSVLQCVRKISNGLIRVTDDFKNYLIHPKIVPVVFFDGQKNVGDQLNAYLIRKMFGKKIYKAKTNKLPHVRFVGSVLGSASWQSYIYGGGSIDGKKPLHKIDKKKIYALRGKKTLKLVREHCQDDSFDVPLGDPGLILPLYYSINVKKEKKVGLVPHFVDKNNAIIQWFRGDSRVLIIDVGSEVEDFVDKLLSCDFVLSSSLHGLILSDAYAIPNKRLIFSSKVLGGDFKFEDYYSVTSSPEEKGLTIYNEEDLEKVIDSLQSICSVKKYVGDIRALHDTFKSIGSRHG
ncbi:hypothetical protein GCM10007160_37760 [Litchfieldella qijiaojingensis]|uniref:Polysaccharide pyruvyl transferase domain-containing protein n=1 Tax=Litchfieldella qijiaojingensis TaxID=980347 RepID=A0ABQ2Z6J9_9GAMM|nr:polysaccharide pyruvyl transferase family protein [Halomonas qijiaojingensis]GGY06641.1 hypothetical protein GCM10007160_37760 [Halomonas qijiaojingensis]